MDLKLISIGLEEPTVVECEINGKIERVESRRLDLFNLVDFWKDCFDYNAYIADPVILHCTPQQIEQMQRMKVGANDAATVYERLTTYGVQIVSDTQKQLTTKELVAKLLQQYNFGGTIIIDRDELLKFM